ncbi:nucleoside-diphosphate sugar epimerase/dehydratase [Alteribacillus bidgolensis]|uniref:NDP-sugar epimerase, includes UDP-GlcNAc-inverting 4,6-dehydratase FlaA1 and capsular polysaccharide biosynthesis protein EpsC n=1 Tax=Alteribacillus bidgolensis TaxID=930129 RepID=A0A1G8PQ55_9BACI|nr:nucleoside-diphosphate sugar epimerase/dehydratase [Alteribacillus bidgolensis]SDI94365.1 NDP-sugar epimerase, includes UDP-GlcNAc-inverting 4,6-dehydratase FlaA1 and capsular polysaccharide biosynthesis protein EpsC [Alteribacillus bidgolensis]
MTYGKRLLALMGIDSFIVMIAVFIGGFLIYNTDYVGSAIIFASSFTLVVSHHLFAYIFNLYKRVWQYASINELKSIFKAITLSIITTAAMQIVVFDALHIRTLTITWMLHILLIGGSRFAWRIYRDTYIKPSKNKKRTLIVGAGNAGTMVARQMQQSNESELLPVAYVDDDMTKQHLEIMGVPVAGQIKDIQQVVENAEIEHIVIAIPSLQKQDVQRIYEECLKTNIKTQILPLMEDLLSGKVSVNQFRDVQVEDLLGREPVELDIDGISESITGKTVLVTGAGGSIGSEICRQITKFNPARLILLGHGENSIYDIEMELKQCNIITELVTEISDIKDKEKMELVFERERPDVVFHAAAHKHVPLMERNPEEAVKNNVIGTKNVAEAADENGTSTFVMISSDKAVNPTSVMGATKRIAEMVVQHMDKTSPTRFVSVRFGNVLGSRGSVIPLFKKQIQKGGPVTVTHPEMTRYFMTIPEASRLVIQAGALARGGEIFLLDMGEPVKIVVLAKNLIKLSGYSEDEIGIKYTGMRPGEKMFEELLKDDEVYPEQIYPKIHIGKTPEVHEQFYSGVLNNYPVLTSTELRDTLINIANFKTEDYTLTKMS